MSATLTEPAIGGRLTRIVLYAVLLLFAAFYLLPLFVMLTTSVKPLEEIQQGSLIGLPSSITFAPWAAAWGSTCIATQCEGLAPYFWNSLRMSVPAVLISTLLGAFNGYVLTKWRFPGDTVVFALILFGSFIPFQAVLLPMARTLGALGWSNTVQGLVLVHVVYGLSFTTLFFRNFYIGVPDELVRAAKIDGAGFFTTFFRILLPLSVPIVMVTIIWQFTQIWNDFLFGASFTYAGNVPVTVALNNVVNASTGAFEYNVNMAATVIAALPTLLVYVLAGRYFLRGLTAGAVKG